MEGRERADRDFGAAAQSPGGSESLDDLAARVGRVADGNAGATNVLMDLLSRGGKFAVEALERAGVRGDEVWVLFADVCGSDLQQLLDAGLLLPEIPAGALHAALQEAGLHQPGQMRELLREAAARQPMEQGSGPEAVSAGYEEKAAALRTMFPHLGVTVGYIGNLESWGDDRRWMVWTNQRDSQDRNNMSVDIPGPDFDVEKVAQALKRIEETVNRRRGAAAEVRPPASSAAAGGRLVNGVLRTPQDDAFDILTSASDLEASRAKEMMTLGSATQRAETVWRELKAARYHGLDGEFGLTWPDDVLSVIWQTRGSDRDGYRVDSGGRRPQIVLGAERPWHLVVVERPIDAAAHWSLRSASDIGYVIANWADLGDVAQSVQDVVRARGDGPAPSIELAFGTWSEERARAEALRERLENDGVTWAWHRPPVGRSWEETHERVRGVRRKNGVER